jgi:hypothetical protein
MTEVAEEFHELRHRPAARDGFRAADCWPVISRFQQNGYEIMRNQWDDSFLLIHAILRRDDCLYFVYISVQPRLSGSGLMHVSRLVRSAAETYPREGLHARLVLVCPFIGVAAATARAYGRRYGVEIWDESKLNQRLLHKQKQPLAIDPAPSSPPASEPLLSTPVDIESPSSGPEDGKRKTLDELINAATRHSFKYAAWGVCYAQCLLLVWIVGSSLGFIPTPVLNLMTVWSLFLRAIGMFYKYHHCRKPIDAVLDGYTEDQRMDSAQRVKLAMKMRGFSSKTCAVTSTVALISAVWATGFGLYQDTSFSVVMAVISTAVTSLWLFHKEWRLRFDLCVLSTHDN